MMRSFLRVVPFAIVVLAFVSLSAFSQDKKEPRGSLSGRVTVGDKPIPRADVILTPAGAAPFQRTPPIKATTDEEGEYRLSGVPAGSYTISPFTPAFVVPAETSSAEPGKSITLRDDEEVEKLDFSLIRGGVITGRVTDADGRPVVEQIVNIIRVDERGQHLPAVYNPFRFSTDDRGIYRVYGLAPGRYKVSVGDAPDSGIVRIGYGGGTYARTYHPDVADEARAPAIEVSAGGETSEIDIKLGRPSRTYIATGRVIEADLGKPLADLQFAHGSLAAGQTNIGAFGWTGNRTNANGEFRIEGLAPGRYAAFVITTEKVDFYSEPAVFQVSDADVNGLEIKVRRGASINGQAVIEGASESDTLAQLSKLQLRALVRSEQVTPPVMTPIRIDPDGSFVITGLRPGKVRIILGGFPPPKGFSLLRVERENVEQRDGIDVGVNENVSGVRVVIGYGTGVLRGDVKIQNGQLDPDTRLQVTARRLNAPGPVAVSAAVDARGRFILEGLIPGDYEVVLNAMSVRPPSAPGPAPPGVVAPKFLAKQNVTVSNGSDAEVTLVVDLGAKEKESDK